MALQLWDGRTWTRMVSIEYQFEWQESVSQLDVG